MPFLQCESCVWHEVAQEDTDCHGEENPEGKKSIQPSKSSESGDFLAVSWSRALRRDGRLFHVLSTGCCVLGFDRLGTARWQVSCGEAHNYLLPDF